MSLYDGKWSRRPSVDRVVAELAAEQHGVVGLGQLEGLGLGAHLVDRRVVAGRMHRVHQGVYAVGHPRLTTHGRFMAAVLACGEGAVLSHRSAVELWNLRPPAPNAVLPVDVTAPNRRGRWPAGIRAHRNGMLIPQDRTRVEGIPCTTSSKTLLDFAAVASPWEVRKA